MSMEARHAPSHNFEPTNSRFSPFFSKRTEHILRGALVGVAVLTAFSHSKSSDTHVNGVDLNRLTEEQRRDFLDRNPQSLTEEGKYRDPQTGETKPFVPLFPEGLCGEGPMAPDQVQGCPPLASSSNS